MASASRLAILAVVGLGLAAAPYGADRSQTATPSPRAADPAAPHAGTPEDREFLERGRGLYRVYCSNCHGESGSGDGPVSRSLKVAPTDLTLLARGADGEFPFDRVFRTIDGRERVPLGHGETAMPFWGLAFQQFDQVTDQENEVQARILELTGYLRSLQRGED